MAASAGRIPLHDRAVFWLTLAAAVGVVAAGPFAFGLSEVPKNQHLWANAWVWLGVVLWVLSMLAIIYAVGLHLAQQRAAKRQEQEPTTAPTTETWQTTGYRQVGGFSTHEDMDIRGFDVGVDQTGGTLNSKGLRTDRVPVNDEKKATREDGGEGDGNAPDSGTGSR
jgi:hypothetical protein